MTLNTPSSVSVGVRPMISRTFAYSSAFSPKSRASAWLTSRSIQAACGQRIEQRLAVGPAHQRIHQVLRMRHQPEHAQILAEYTPAMLRALPFRFASGVTSPPGVA